jgi:hypothetical protein
LRARVARIEAALADPDTYWSDNPTRVQARLVGLRSLLEDVKFWQNADMEPQPLQKDAYTQLDDSSWDRAYVFQNCAYGIRGAFTPEEDRLLVQDAFDTERRKFERLERKFQLAHHTKPRNERTAIPEEVRVAVWRRDSGRCVRCGSRERLEYDHIIPVSGGGSSTVRNIELLCEACNRSKGANIQ